MSKQEPLTRLQASTVRSHPGSTESSSSASSNQGNLVRRCLTSTQPPADNERCHITDHQRAFGVCALCGSAFCGRAADCSTTVAKTTGTFTSTTTTSARSKPAESHEPADVFENDSDEEQSEQDNATESQDISQRLSEAQEHELDELAEKRDGVAERLQSLESDLETLNAAEHDTKMEIDRLGDLEQRDPEAAARSRELLADEICHNHIGQDRANVVQAIRSAEAEDEDLDHAMEEVYARGEDDDDDDDDDGGSNHEDNFNEDSAGGYSSGGGCGGYGSYESDGDNGDYDGQY